LVCIAFLFFQISNVGFVLRLIPLQAIIFCRFAFSTANCESIQCRGAFGPHWLTICCELKLSQSCWLEVLRSCSTKRVLFL